MGGGRRVKKQKQTPEMKANTISMSINVNR